MITLLTILLFAPVDALICEGGHCVSVCENASGDPVQAEVTIDPAPPGCRYTLTCPTGRAYLISRNSFEDTP